MANGGWNISSVMLNDTQCKLVATKLDVTKRHTILCPMPSARSCEYA